MAGSRSWEGQGLTLVIFSGVVVLCSVFFVLGMLAGRSQVTTVVDSDVMDMEAEPALAEEPGEPPLTFYDSVAESELPGLEVSSDSSPPAPLRGENEVSADTEPERATARPPVVQPPDVVATILQVVALANREQAQSLRQELVDKGFPAFVLLPGPDDPVPLNRVQVGPLADDAEVARVRAALEAEGHSPIVVR
jgi:cell division septation protein DedD